MTETAAPASFVVIPRTEERGGYENECFTHYVQDNGGRYRLQVLITRTRLPPVRALVFHGTHRGFDIGVVRFEFDVEPVTFVVIVMTDVGFEHAEM
ncbi:hypothetical protein [Rhodococcus sp. D-46]|uniref:hypothetical protein n=1 Tax=Rhodococcus sp. D-46 TaxID=2716265 RepID=UPI001A999CCB